MKIVARWLLLLATFGGGALAAFAIRESAANDYSYAAEQHGLAGVLVTPQWAGTVAAAVAIVALTVLLRARSRAASVVTVLAGAAAIGLPDVVAVDTTPAATLNAVGAGLILAATVYPAVGRRDCLIAVSTGVLMATVLFGVAGMWRVPSGRWAVTLADEPFYVPATLPLPVLLLAVIALGTIALATRLPEQDVSARAVTVGVVLPVVFLVLYVALGSTTSGSVSWTVAVGFAVAATLAAAWWLRGRTGRMLLVGMALAAVMICQVHYFADAEWWLLGILPFAAGLILGRRSPPASLVVGLALLAVVTASGLVSGGPIDSATVTAYALVLPGVVGLCVASVLSTAPLDPQVVVSGALMPLTMTFFAVSAPRGPIEAAWSNSFPVTDSALVITVIAPLPVGMIVAVVTVAIAAVALVRTAGREGVERDCLSRAFRFRSSEE